MTDFIITETPSSTIITEVPDDIVLMETPSVTILTEGAQGPMGPPGTASLGGVQLEMGETLTRGTPVYVSANKFYAADNVTNFRVVGILDEDAAITFMGSAVAIGQLTLMGLTPGLPYFLGNEQITAIAPASGHIVRIGQALTTTELSVNIEESILLV